MEKYYLLVLLAIWASLGPVALAQKKEIIREQCKTQCAGQFTLKTKPFHESAKSDDSNHEQRFPSFPDLLKPTANSERSVASGAADFDPVVNPSTTSHQNASGDNVRDRRVLTEDDRKKEAARKAYQDCLSGCEK